MLKLTLKEEDLISDLIKTPQKKGVSKKLTFIYTKRKMNLLTLKEVNGSKSDEKTRKKRSEKFE